MLKSVSGLLDPKVGSYTTGGSVEGSWSGKTGDQNVDMSHPGNIGPTKSFGDSFETSGATGSVSTRGSAGGVNYSAGASGPSFQLEGKASGKVGTSGIDVHADVHIDASLVKAGAQAEKTIPVTLPGGEQIQVKLDLAAAGEVGANGDLHVDVHIGTDGQVKAQVSASGFAGAKAGITGTVAVMHGNDTIAKADATLSAYAGVAGSASAHVSFGLHGVSFGAEAAAAAGAGFGVQLNGEFDPAAAGKLALAMAGDLAKEGADGAKKDVVDWGTNVGKGVASTAGDVGKEAGKVAGTVGKTAGNVAGSIGKTVSGWF